MTEAARRMGVRRENLSLLIHGQIGISPKMALALERVGISNADFWMRRQADTTWRKSACGRISNSRGLREERFSGRRQALSAASSASAAFARDSAA